MRITHLLIALPRPLLGHIVLLPVLAAFLDALLRDPCFARSSKTSPAAGQRCHHARGCRVSRRSVPRQHPVQEAACRHRPAQPESGHHAHRCAMPSSAQHAAHALPMLLNATDGSIQLGNLPALIGPTLLLDEARAAFAPLVRGGAMSAPATSGSACTSSAWAARPLASACASSGNSSTW